MSKKRSNFFIEEKQIENLKALSLVTRVKMSEYVREGIDLVLQKYRKEKRAGKKR